jgi:hypothetical protein
MLKKILVLVGLLLANHAFAVRLWIVPADSIAPDYDRAVDLCLFHNYAEAELELRQITARVDHPNYEVARSLLTEEVYLWRGEYQKYVHFGDSTGYKPHNYAFARHMLNQPAVQIELPVDSLVLAFTLKKKGHVVVKVLVNGQPRTFMVDTGCQRSIISTKLAEELQLTKLLDDSIRNSLNQTIASPVSLLNSVQVGALRVTNLPVWVGSMWGFGVDGALGWDVLRQFHVTFDYKNRQLILRKPITQATPARNLLGGSRPLIAFQSTTGEWLNLFFDSGSNGRVSLSPNGLTKIGQYKSRKTLGFQMGFGGRIRLRKENLVKRTTIRIHNDLYPMKRPGIMHSNELICSVITDGIVGSRQFLKGRLTLDFANNRFTYQQ